MSDLTPTVTIVDGQARVSSIDISEKFHKRHTHVLGYIKKLIAELDPDFTGPNFGLSEYTDPTGRKLPYYSLTRDAFSLVVMGFTGKEALQWKVKYIEAFNAMEAELLKRADADVEKEKQPASSTERVRKCRERKKLAQAQFSLASGKDEFEAWLDELESCRAMIHNKILELGHKGASLAGNFSDNPFNYGLYAVITKWVAQTVISPHKIQNEKWEDPYAIVRILRMLKQSA